MSKGISVKTLKRMLKKAGLKLGGRKAALTRRAKKAGMLPLPQRSPGTGIMPPELFRIPMRSMTTGIPRDEEPALPKPPPSNLRTNAALPPPEPPKEEKKEGGRHRRSRKH